MFYADTVGLEKVLECDSVLSERLSRRAVEPAPLLVKLAKEGRKFNE